MRKSWNRMIALALALAFILALAPQPGAWETAYAVGSYGRVLKNGTFVRKQPGSDSYWFKLDTGFICTVTDTTSEGGYTWYKVDTQHPDPDKTNTYVGYIRGDCFEMLTEAEAIAWEANPVQATWATSVPATATPTPAPDAGTGQGTVTEVPTATPTAAPVTSMVMGRITNGGTNFRESEGGPVIQKLDRDTLVEVLTIPAVIDTSHWYQVRYNGYVGYIQAPFLEVLGNVTPTPTPAMTAPASGGYVKLILSSANLRESPGGSVKAQWEVTGQVLPIAGSAVKKSGYTWYPVAQNGVIYYVRGDCVEVVASLDGNTGTVATATPTAVPVTMGYIRTTVGGVNLRLQPAGNTIQQIKKNEILPYMSSTVSEGYTWYYVQVDNIRGYVRGDCAKVCNADGSDVTVTAGPATAVPTAEVSSYGYVKLTEDKVNLRAKPAGTRLEQLDLGLVLPMTGVAVSSGSYTWYPVKAPSGRTGYVRGDCAMECDQNGTASGAVATATPAPGTTAAPSSYGYVKITLPKTNLRKTAAGSVIQTVDKDTVWPMTGTATTSKGYTWYPINVNGTLGYVRGDCSFKLSATQEESYLAGNGVPDENNGSGGGTATASTYLITVLDKVNLRASPSKDANAPYNIPLGTVMAYNNQQTVGGSLWYRVVYDNTQVWVLGSCVSVMTQAEYEEWLATQPTITPQPEVVVGYVVTVTGGVNLRTTANGSKIIGRLDEGVVMPYSAEPTELRGYLWYPVKTTLGTGYVRGDCVEECTASGGALPTATPGPTSSSPTAGQEATYKTLRLGSTGTEVKAMVTELKTQGYYSGSITSSYTSAVQTAVKNFQRANGLTVDGIAGPNTLHKLFGTVPVGESDTSDLTMTIYPAEKIDWYTGGIQQLWPKGANFKVYDVKTGIVWWAHRWSGGSHVDAEPLTAADTARLCKIYGVSTADEIAEKNLWQRRPMLVTIGNRTFACSLYGVPHNYPDGDTIANNDYNGQLCIHFTNSKTHDSNKVDSYHSEAIEYAWLNAPNGHK